MNLGGGRGVVGSMSLPGSSQTRKTSPAESDEFPAGLRVLVVDDDPTCLKILERMLVTCRYDVTKCSRVDYALNELRNNKNGFDVVISDVHMPNMDGFKLLEYVGLEMDLPVIMMSADDSKNVVMKGVKHGACDYLTKPIRMEALKNIWQHVVRKKKNEWPEVEPLDKKAQRHRHDANEENWKSSKRKGDDEEADDKDDYGGFKKQRVVWSVELHQQFVAAVNQLGVDKAVPKRILELMDVRGLTRENVASHLQKYRLCLRKLIGEPHRLGGMANSYMPNAAFGSMASLGGIDLQTLTAYQPSLPGLPHINPGLSMPIRQTNAFGYESSSISRLSELQHLQQLNKSNQQSYLLHGNSTAVEPRRLTSFYQSAESLETILQQPLLSTEELVGALPRNILADNIQGMPYTSGNNFPELSGLIQEDANLAKKHSRGFGTEYDLFNELSQQQKPQAWLDASSSLGGIQHKSSFDNINATTTSVLGNQNQGYIRNSINGNKNVFSTGPVAQEGLDIQSGNNLADENVSSGMKPAEAVQEASSASNHYHFEFEQDDLLSIMLKQQEQVTGASEGEFDFAALDDIF